jgi:hypothetical protein
MRSTDAILYGSDESGESQAMVDLLNELGVAFEYRGVDRDPTALREPDQAPAAVRLGRLLADSRPLYM